MNQTAITFSGLKITFSKKNAPVTSGMKSLIAGKAPKKSAVTPAKKIALTRGEPSSHCSCKIRFESPVSYEDEKGRNGRRRVCKWNDGRKPKGFKPSRVKITQMIF